MQISRTALHAKANIYPFRRQQQVLPWLPASLGGAKLAKLSSHSDSLAQFISKYPNIQMIF